MNLSQLSSRIGASDTQLDWEDKFHGLMAVTACIAILISVLAGYFGQLTIGFIDCLPRIAIVVALAVAALQYRYRDEVKCYQICMMVMWVILITNVHLFPMYFAARLDVPMHDGILASFDQMMGLEVTDVLAWIEGYPRLNRFMLNVYNSLIPFMTIATVLPLVFNRMDRAKGFALSCLVAAIVSLPIFACFQVVGPYHYYGYESIIASLSEIEGMFTTLKADGWYHIDANNMDGLISFPSFHVILTALAAIAVWPFRYVRWPAVAWATLIIMSTVTCGVHYLVDAVAGLAIVGLAHCVVMKYLEWESSERKADWSILRRKPTTFAN